MNTAPSTAKSTATTDTPYPRDAKGRILPGNAGRKPGSKNKLPRQEKPEERAVRLAHKRMMKLTGQAVKILEEQLNSDDPDARTGAARLVLSKTTPDARHKGHTVNLPELAEAPTLTEKTKVVDMALADGRITPEQAKTLLSALKDSAEIADLESASAVVRLLRRGKAIYEAVQLVDTLGPTRALEYSLSDSVNEEAIQSTSTSSN